MNGPVDQALAIAEFDPGMYEVVENYFGLHSCAFGELRRRQPLTHDCPSSSVRNDHPNAHRID
jgi:hypothetical protein